MHTCNIYRVSPQYGDRYVSSNYHLLRSIHHRYHICRVSHSTDIDVSSNYQSLKSVHHRYHICRVYPQIRTCLFKGSLFVISCLMDLDLKTAWLVKRKIVTDMPTLNINKSCSTDHHTRFTTCFYLPSMYILLNIKRDHFVLLLQLGQFLRHCG